MPDRVKEAIFGILGSMFDTPGELPPFAVIDLFAGSGSLGLEAVSRGAGKCTFFERDRAVLRILRENVESLDHSEELRIAAGDAWRFRPSSDHGIVREVGLVFLDPPYRDARDTGPESRIVRLIEKISQDARLRRDAVLVVHHERSVTLAPATGASWMTADRREYGSTAITFIQPGDEDSEPAPDQPSQPSGHTEP